MARAKVAFRKPCAGELKKLTTNPITSRKANSRPMKQIFKGLTISAAGTFKGVNGDISHEQLGKWIKAHGGAFESKVTDDTTHLICSIEEFKQKSTQVQKAWQLARTRCQIVTFDWIEDCLLGPKQTKRLLKERAYTLDRTLINLKKGIEVDKVALRKRFDENARIAHELSNSNMYHIYYEDGFEYKVILSRVRLDGKTMIEKYTLYLFESNTKAPLLYMFGAKYSRSHRPLTFWRQDCRPMDFHTAFTCFKKFFKERSGIDWDDRLERIIPKKIENNKVVEHNFFKYLPPPQGRATGLLPCGYVRPEDRVVEVADSEGEGDREAEVGYDTDSEVGDDGDDASDEMSDEDNGGKGSDTSASDCGSTSGSGSALSQGSTSSGVEYDGIISISTSDREHHHDRECS
ncbi:hypothetical protein BKA64DRAFT_773789 [Cadophora sp. MPI-SDFR-AT-0126]|nr:hypothetical protein BKA64DRAFT_773789 [Leotiomycetes sp. MPI-SDFR-AT-0126]